MSSVADELAALRAKGGGVKARAAGLNKGACLSTPEAEAAALKAKREQDKLGKASAKEILSKGGSGAASQELEHSLQQKAKKKAEQDKSKSTKEMLSRGGGGGGVDQAMEHTLQQKAKKKAEQDKVNEAKKSLSKGSTSTKAAKGGEETAATSPDAAAPQAPKEKETTDDDAAAALIEVDDVDDADDVPDLEEADDIPELDGGMNNIQQTTGDAESRPVTNRNEKKARKMMERLGMKPVNGIERATFKTGGQGGYFFIDNPDVYTMGKTYVIFGEAKQGGNMQQQQAAMAQQQAQAAMAQQQQQQQAANMMMSSVAEEGVEIEELPELAEESVDESGVDDKDIGLVMSQASCSRTKAVKALKENDNDLVNAIMSLTT